MFNNKPFFFNIFAIESTSSQNWSEDNSYFLELVVQRFEGHSNKFRWYKDGSGAVTRFSDGGAIDAYVYFYTIDLTKIPENNYYCVPFGTNRLFKDGGVYNGSGDITFVKKDANTLSWYSTSAHPDFQLNAARSKYYWYAFTK